MNGVRSARVGANLRTPFDRIIPLCDSLGSEIDQVGRCQP